MISNKTYFIKPLKSNRLKQNLSKSFEKRKASDEKIYFEDLNIEK